MNKTLTYNLSIIIVFFVCSSLNGQYIGDELFKNTFVHTIEIECDTELSTLSDIYLSEIFVSDYSYAMANVTIDGNLVDSVGIRVKGGLSAFDTKKPLKIDFNEFVAGKEYDGIKKVNLHQGNMDPSFIRDKLAYDLFRNAGVKTVRTAFAEVYYNGVYEGLYTIVEQVNDSFIKELFADNAGALYKTGFNGLELKYAVDTTLTFEQLETVVNQINVEDLHTELPKYIDMESTYKMIAHEIFLGNNDGPLISDVNYYLYYEPKSKRYSYIPWDYNLVLYGAKHSLLQESSNFIFERIKENETLRQDYLTTFCKLMKYNFTVENLAEMINGYESLITDAASNDPYFTTNNLSEEIEFIRTFSSSRIDDFQQELDALNIMCYDISTLLSFLDVSINEFMASNNSESNISDSDGGFPDWIEIYNNTIWEITLDDLYLSNDRDFLKHWNFGDNQVLNQDSYLIIWADRDVDEEGNHSDFKLNKDDGQLFLSNELGIIIDQIGYTDQTTNISSARIPNGHGPFVKQPPTFNGDNSVSLNTEDPLLTSSSLILYPNPAVDKLTIEILDHLELSSPLLKVINSCGEVVIEEKLKDEAVDVHALPPGIYLVTVQDKGSNYQAKFVKQ